MAKASKFKIKEENQVTKQIRELNQQLADGLKKIHDSAAQDIKETQRGSVQEKCELIAENATKAAQELHDAVTGQIAVLTQGEFDKASRKANQNAEAAGQAVQATVKSINYAVKGHVVANSVSGFWKGLGIKNPFRKKAESKS